MNQSKTGGHLAKTKMSVLHLELYIGGTIDIYIYIYLFIKFASAFAVSDAPELSGFGRSRAFGSFVLPGLEKCRYLLHMAARAWPGAADGSKWLLEPAPEPQLARNGRSSPPRSRRILEKCRSSLPRSRRMLDGGRSSLPRNRRMLDRCRSSHPGGAECWPRAADGSKWLLEPAREPQMARNGRSSPPGAADGSKWPLEPAPEPQNT